MDLYTSPSRYFKGLWLICFIPKANSRDKTEADTNKYSSLPKGQPQSRWSNSDMVISPEGTFLRYWRMKFKKKGTSRAKNDFTLSEHCVSCRYSVSIFFSLTLMVKDKRRFTANWHPNKGHDLASFPASGRQKKERCCDNDYRYRRPYANWPWKTKVR